MNSVIAIGLAVLCNTTHLWGKEAFPRMLPSGIINEDHGILSSDDLKQLEKDSGSTSRSEGRKVGSYSWQCFDKKSLRYSCSYVEPLDKQGSSLGLEIETTAGIHFYSHGHAISGETCKELLSNLRRILKDQKYFCIYGILDSVKKAALKTEYSWSFYRLKTKSGYVHYFMPD